MHTTLSSRRYLREKDEIVLQKKIVNKTLEFHDHEFIEIAYIAEGCGLHSICGREEAVSRGDLFVIAPRIPHLFVGRPEEPLTVYNCIFEPSAIDSSMDDTNNFFDIIYRYLFHASYGGEKPRDYLHLFTAKERDFEQTLRDMYMEYTEQKTGYSLLLRSGLIRLLVLTFRHCLKDASRRKDLPVFHRLVIENTQTYLNHHYAEEITNAALAARAYISEGYFRRIYKSVTGTTVIEALQDIRCQKACGLIETTDRTIAEIARSVGYSDIKYFYSIFLRKKGCTPGEYRRRVLSAKDGPSEEN